MADRLPNTVQWAGHMTSLGPVVGAGHRLGWDMEAFRRAVGGGPEVGHSGPDSGADCGSGRVVFEVCQQPCEDKEEREIEMELR